jgi:hypothetical protein
MSRYDNRTPASGEAEIEYLDGDFRILRPGGWVICAATGQRVAIDELRYWDVDRQEAYASPQAKLTRMGVDVKLVDSASSST